MDEVNVTLEKYAILCALMADTGGDIQKENDIALAKGVSPGDWKDAKEYFTAKMQDPADPSSKIDHLVVIAENGFTHAEWLEMEGYWTPRVGSDEFPESDPVLALKFRELFQKEADRLNG